MLAEAKSNRPEAGTGADMFRRVARDCVTVAHAVAGAALADAVGAPRVNVGWDVTLSPARSKPAARARRAARRGAVHARTGARETMAYAAQAGSAGALVARVAGERLTMADLDAETRAALVMAELPSLLPDVNDAKVLALAVEAARELPPDGETPEGVARRAALTRVLLAALDGTPSAAMLRRGGELVDIIALPDAAPERRVLEERVWTLFAHGRPSAPMRALAEKVGLAVAKSHRSPAAGNDGPRTCSLGYADRPDDEASPVAFVRCVVEFAARCRGAPRRGAPAAGRSSSRRSPPPPISPPTSPSTWT